MSTWVGFPFFLVSWFTILVDASFLFYLLTIMDIHEAIFKWKVYLLLLTIYREAGLLGQS